MRNFILEEDLVHIHARVNHRGEWADATVVVTGCSGFLGYYFMHYFARWGKTLGVKKVIGLDNFLFGQPAWLDQLIREASDVLEIRAFDIAKDDITTVSGADEARYVIHGASIASPTYYRRYPLETIDANVWGLRKLLDFYHHSNTLKGFLFFSSSEIYGEPDSHSLPTDEEYRGNVSCHGPRACYDEAKRFGETMCWIYAKQFCMPITVARPFNNYGPGMRLDDKRLPADMASTLLQGGDIVILSDGTPTRTFCYVSDAISGYLLCLTHGKYDYFNIGIDNPEISVAELAFLYRQGGIKYFGYKGDIKYQKSEDVNYLTDNPNRRCPIINKAREILGFNPTILIEEGVDRHLKYLKLEGLN